MPFGWLLQHRARPFALVRARACGSQSRCCWGTLKTYVVAPLDTLPHLGRLLRPAEPCLDPFPSLPPQAAEPGRAP